MSERPKGAAKILAHRKEIARHRLNRAEREPGNFLRSTEGNSAEEFAARIKDPKLPKPERDTFRNSPDGKYLGRGLGS